MRWRFAAVVLAALAAAPGIAQADSFDPISFGASASSLGAGITLERPLLFDLSARIATGWLSYTSEQTYDNNQWNQTAHESNVLVAADWRPYGGRWRLSAGLLFGSDHSDYAAKPIGGTYQLNGNTYDAAGSSITSTVSFARPAIYLGAGAGTGIVKGLTIAFDAGIVLRNGSTATSVSGPLQHDPQAVADANATAAQFRTHIIQPVVGVGLLFRP
jgi:hypothetical protein